MEGQDGSYQMITVFCFLQSDLPELENPTSERLRCFISHLMDSRPGGVSFLVLR